MEMRMRDRRSRYGRQGRTESVARVAIAVANRVVDFGLLLFILLLIVFGVYSLWDTQQIYSAADAKQYETYKPTTEEESLSFDELRHINSDVFAWLDVYGTNIDYPVVRSEDNNKYLNMDPEGNFALSGSLFLDAENRADFSDPKNIIYGHHMEKEKMFGGLDQFGEEAYFNSHSYGDLYFDYENHGLVFLAFVEGDAYDSMIYSITHKADGAAGNPGGAEAAGTGAAGETVSTANVTNPENAVDVANAASTGTTGAGAANAAGAGAGTGTIDAIPVAGVADAAGAAGTTAVYGASEPGISAGNAEFLDWLREHAKCWRDVGVTAEDTLVLLSTCASGETNLRYILVGVLTDQTYENPFPDETDDGALAVLRGIGGSIWKTLPKWWYLLVLLLLAAVLLLLVRRRRSRRYRRRRR